MPICIDSEILQQLIRPGLALRKDGECRIDINPDMIRLRTMSEDYEAYLDYSFPTSALRLLADDITGNYWTRLVHVKDFLNVGTGEEVRITTPTETEDSMIVLQSDGLTYQFQSVVSKYAHRVYDNFTSEPIIEFTLPNEVFARAIKVANLLGGDMRVKLDSNTRHVEFSATGRGIADSFSYSHPAEQISNTHQSTLSLTISIERLRDIIPFIPPATPISLQLMEDKLVYRSEFPVPDAEITLYIAERLGRIHK